MIFDLQTWKYDSWGPSVFFMDDRSQNICNSQLCNSSKNAHENVAKVDVGSTTDADKTKERTDRILFDRFIYAI